MDRETQIRTIKESIAAVDKISRDIFTLLRDIDYILPEAKRQSRVSAILQKQERIYPTRPTDLKRHCVSLKIKG